MASYDATIRLLADISPADKALDRLLAKVNEIKAASIIAIKGPSDASSGVKKQIDNYATLISLLERYKSGLEEIPTLSKSPIFQSSGGGKVGDAFRVAKKQVAELSIALANAKDNFKEVFQEQRQVLGVGRDVRNYANQLEFVASILGNIKDGFREGSSEAKNLGAAIRNVVNELQTVRPGSGLTSEIQEALKPSTQERVSGPFAIGSEQINATLNQRANKVLSLQQKQINNLSQINRLRKAGLNVNQADNLISTAGNQLRKGNVVEAEKLVNEAREELDTLNRINTIIRKNRNERRREFIQQNRSRRRRNSRAAASNALIGGAFPLLFGQGVGAAVGGFIGGGAGGLLGGQFGFALSLVGTAVGEAVDTFVQNLRKVSDSLKSPTETLQALEEVGFSVSDSVKLTVEELLEANKIYEAQAVALQEITDRLGPNSVELLNAFSEETKKLNSEYQQLSASITSAVLPALVGLIALLNDFSSILRSVEVPQQLTDFLLRLGAAGAGGVLPGLGQAQTTVDFVSRRGLRAGEEAGQPGLSPQLKAQESRAANKAVEEERGLERKVELLRAQEKLENAGKDILNEKVVAARKQVIQQQYYAELVDEAARGLDTEAPKIRRNTALAKLRNDIEQKRLSLQKRAAREAARQAEKEARQALAIIKRLRQQTRQNQVKSFNIDLQQLDVNSARVAANQGEVFGLGKQLDSLQTKKDLQISIARLTIEDTENLKKQEELIRSRIDLEQTLLVTKIKQSVAQERINELRRQTGTDFGQLSGTFRPVLALQDNVGFEAGAGLSGVVSQEVAVAKLTEKYKELGLVAQASSDLVTFGVMEMVNGTKSAEEVFASFLRSIADMLLRTVSTMVAQYILLGTARLFATGSSLSSGPGGFDLGKNFFGGSPLGGLGFNTVIPRGRATGGPVGANQAYMVGERGPELFVPRGSGTIVPNNKMGGGVTVGSVNITVENTGERLDPAAQKQIASQVKGIVLATLSDERRSGGLL